ncbi:response regulator transcription factor [Patescibacteria group bacterium]|nr:response regulator transcription factor [Patescibacteria group bacterium]
MRLLIIEDEEKLALSLKKALEAERYAVDVSFDGEEGYEKASVESYDLLILDVGLPNMDGFEITAKLRQEKVATPIIFLTARDMPRDKVIGLDTGGDDYLVKPFDFEELVARIRALLRRGTTSAAQPILQLDTLSLNPATQKVTRAGKTISLTPKEYSLVEFFLRHPRQVLSKTQLIEHVWNDQADPFSGVADVYIGYVRAKIDKAFPGQKQLLKTLKGRGYSLSDEEEKR